MDLLYQILLSCSPPRLDLNLIQPWPPPQIVSLVFESLPVLALDYLKYLDPTVRFGQRTPSRRGIETNASQSDFALHHFASPPSQLDASSGLVVLDDEFSGPSADLRRAERRGALGVCSVVQTVERGRREPERSKRCVGRASLRLKPGVSSPLSVSMS